MRMKILLTLAAASLLLASAGAPVRAQAIAVPTPCSDGTVSNASGNDVCSAHGGPQGSDAANAAAAPPPAAGVTAKCKDGTYSTAKHRHGACSSHGGVAEWMDKK
jgi:hypothetical protein